MRTLFSTPLLLTLVLALVLTGCSAGVTRPSDESQTSNVLLTEPATITLTLSDDARKQAASNTKFNEDVFLGTLTHALDAKGLLAKNDAPVRRITVEVTGVRVRGTFSAIMFGFMAGPDHLKGRVTLIDADNNPLRFFDVSATYAFGGVAGGQDGTRLGWLYERFAQEMINELTGKTKSGTAPNE